jgi:hypothetical protein
LFLLGQRHQLFRDRAVGVGTVIEVEFTDAAVRPGGGAACQLGQHHLVDGLVAEPAVVVGPVAVQADEGHDGDTGGAGLGAGLGQRAGAVVGP